MHGAVLNVFAPGEQAQKKRAGFNARALGRVCLALFFVVAGANHFLSPSVYRAIMPPLLPVPALLVQISGVAEILGGLGLLVRPTRRLAALGLIALLLAVFPANIYGALHGMTLHGWPVPAWLLWLRLPFQLLFIWWVYSAGWKAAEVPPSFPHQ